MALDRHTTLRPRLDERGATLFGVRDGLIAWGRLYVEPVEQDGGDIEKQMQDRLGGAATR